MNNGLPDVSGIRIVKYLILDANDSFVSPKVDVLGFTLDRPSTSNPN